MTQHTEEAAALSSAAPRRSICKQRTAVVLQAYRLTECLVRQLESMQAQLGPYAELFLLFDDTNGGYDAARIDRLGVRAATWTRADMEVYHELGRDAFDNAYEKLAILRWSASHPEYEQVWLIEDDVAFSGDWRALIEAHCARREDMLGVELDAEATKKLATWLWKRCSFCTPETRQQVSLLLLPAARFSRRLLAEVDRLLSTTEQAARFEIFFPTLCHRRDWCSSALIGQRWLGTYRYRPCVSYLGHADRLYHPVKLDDTCAPKAGCQQKPPTNPVIASTRASGKHGAHARGDDIW